LQIWFSAEKGYNFSKYSWGTSNGTRRKSRQLCLTSARFDLGNVISNVTVIRVVLYNYRYRTTLLTYMYFKAWYLIPATPIVSSHCAPLCPAVSSLGRITLVWIQIRSDPALKPKHNGEWTYFFVVQYGNCKI